MAKKKHGGKRDGAGRPPTLPDEPMTPIGAKLPSTLVTRLDAMAKKQGWSRADALREAVKSLLATK